MSATLTFPTDIDALHPEAQAAFMATYNRVMKATDNDEEKALLAAFGALRRLCSGMPIKSRSGFKQIVDRIEASSRPPVHGHIVNRDPSEVIPPGFYDNPDQYIDESPEGSAARRRENQSKASKAYYRQHGAPPDVDEYGFAWKDGKLVNYNHLTEPKKPARKTVQFTPDALKALSELHKEVKRRQRENAMLYALMHQLAEKRRYIETINIVQPYYPRNGVPFRGRLIVIRRQPIKDDHRQYFTPYTKHGLSVGQVIPITHDHTYEAIGYAKIANITDSGVFIAGEYDRDHPTGLFIYHNARAGVPYYLSSGADMYNLKFAPDGAILEWPVWEATLTTTPADHDTKVIMRY